MTIFPAESVNHSHTIPAQSAMPSQKYDPEMKLGAEPYSTWFYDLQGKKHISNRFQPRGAWDIQIFITST